MTNSHGYILEYPRIRVDHFDAAPVLIPAHLSLPESDTHDAFFPRPFLYLLTHIHTDHLSGLDRPGITAPIYCTHATKHLLLRYERARSRVDRDAHHAPLVRPYAHLRVTTKQTDAHTALSNARHADPHDLLHPLPYNTPTEIPYGPRAKLTLTLIQSNHMFGATMFLIQGPRGAVLHTGDLRAEMWWCDALIRNPAMAPYIADDQHPHSQPPSPAQHSLHSESQSSRDTQQALDTLSRLPFRLENIYLDTEQLHFKQPVPSKQDAVRDMITLLRLYPPDTVFFLDAWTWGYEDMLKAVVKAFRVPVHVDRFKAGMYRAAACEDPFLTQIITTDSHATRFHACERTHMCSAVRDLAEQGTASPQQRKPSRSAVFVTPSSISQADWAAQMAAYLARLRANDHPATLLVPIERHSPFPELEHFVSLFYPRTVSPNTLVDHAHDYRTLPLLFFPEESSTHSPPSFTGYDADYSQAQDTESPNSMTEDLASRYLNVLIHHLNVPYEREAGRTYSQMWTHARRAYPRQALEAQRLYHDENAPQPQPQVQVHESEPEPELSQASLPIRPARPAAVASTPAMPELDPAPHEGLPQPTNIPAVPESPAPDTILNAAKSLLSPGLHNEGLLPPCSIDRSVGYELLLRYLRSHAPTTIPSSIDLSHLTHDRCEPSIILRAALLFCPTLASPSLLRDIATSLLTIMNDPTESERARATAAWALVNENTDTQVLGPLETQLVRTFVDSQTQSEDETQEEII